MKINVKANSAGLSVLDADKKSSKPYQKISALLEKKAAAIKRKYLFKKDVKLVQRPRNNPLKQSFDVVLKKIPRKKLGERNE